MKTTAALLSLAVLTAAAQETKTDAPPPAGSSKAQPSAAELESKFKATLTEATMRGRWCMLRDGQLGPDKEEKYSISSVEKTGENNWTINARIEYGTFSFVAPVPVQVKWAGDTPVIIVDNIGFPGTGKYSARVMIYGNTYAGTWSGGDHGGLLHGVITRGKTEDKAEEKPAEKN